MTQRLVIEREALFAQQVDQVLEHTRALREQAARIAPEPVPLLRRVLLSNLFYLPVFALLGALFGWMAFEPWLSDAKVLRSFESGGVVNPFSDDWFYLVAVGVLTDVGNAIVVAMMWLGDSWSKGKLSTSSTFLFARAAWTMLISFVGGIIVGWLIILLAFIFPEGEIDPSKMAIGWFLFYSSLSILAQSAGGVFIGLGYSWGVPNVKISAAVIGGAVGGAIGGLLFVSLERFIYVGLETELALPRLVSYFATALGAGMFLALGEVLSREGWVRVRSGPVNGKSLSLHRQTTVIGSSPQADIYLFKDAEIEPRHAIVHRIGSRYEVERTAERHPLIINGQAVERRLLQSGDQIVLGATVLEFEERAKSSVALVRPKSTGET